MSDKPVTEVAGASQDFTDPEPPAYTHHDRDWWHRDHPTFTAISAFFCGLAYVALVPATFGAIVTWIFGERAATEAFLFVLLLLALPLILLAIPRTLRFGKYMLLGMLVTAVVVVGVGWVTFLLLMQSGAA